jgi:hypothetical protein
MANAKNTKKLKPSTTTGLEKLRNEVDELNYLREETLFALVTLLKDSRRGIGLLTLGEIALAIKEGLEGDAVTVARLLAEATTPKRPKINYFDTPGGGQSKIIKWILE